MSPNCFDKSFPPPLFVFAPFLSKQTPAADPTITMVSASSWWWINHNTGFFSILRLLTSTLAVILFDYKFTASFWLHNIITLFKKSPRRNNDEGDKIIWVLIRGKRTFQYSFNRVYYAKAQVGSALQLKYEDLFLGIALPPPSNGHQFAV